MGNILAQTVAFAMKNLFYGWNLAKNGKIWTIWQKNHKILDPNSHAGKKILENYQMCRPLIRACRKEFFCEK